MPHELVRPPKARRGDRVAVLSPSFAAAGAFPAVHEQAMRRLAEATGLVPVEFPATRKVGATPAERAADVNAAFADPGIRAILAVVGGDDQITVIPHLDAALARRDPKPFLGYSDNTHMHHWLWVNGIASFYSGSSRVHLGPGPGVDEVHARSLRAVLVTGDRIEITEPGESEDFGVDWADPRALDCFGEREPAGPWSWHGPARTVTGRVRSPRPGAPRPWPRSAISSAKPGPAIPAPIRPALRGQIPPKPCINDLLMPGVLRPGSPPWRSLLRPGCRAIGSGAGPLAQWPD